MMRKILLRAMGVAGALVALLAVAPDVAGAQRRCTKGIPCGNSCISASKTCRIGSEPAPQPSSRPRPLSEAERQALLARALGDTAPGLQYGPWVGSVDGTIYYATSCRTAWKLSEEERVYFGSEQEAIARGYKRSRAKTC